MALLQGAEQHDGGGDGEGEAEDDAGSQRPAEQMGEADARAALRRRSGPWRRGRRWL